jgi:hypothetical protein
MGRIARFYLPLRTFNDSIDVLETPSETPISPASTPNDLGISITGIPPVEAPFSSAFRDFLSA